MPELTRMAWFWPDEAQRIHCYDPVRAASVGGHLYSGHPAYRSLCGRWIKRNGDVEEEEPPPDDPSLCRTCYRRAGGAPT